jgi:hypothetical protein
MRSAHFASGGRYPVLRSLAIIYMIGAIAVGIGGIVLACWMFFSLRGMENHITNGVLTLAGTFLAVLSMLAIAEVLKLFIDIEHNSRMMGYAAADRAVATGEMVDTAATGPNGARMSGKRWLEGEETAEGALLRGH